MPSPVCATTLLLPSAIITSHFCAFQLSSRSQLVEGTRVTHPTSWPTARGAPSTAKTPLFIATSFRHTYCPRSLAAWTTYGLGEACVLQLLLCDCCCSYVALRIMDHLGHGCVFGHPLVTQDRNPHNYFVDHEKERIGLEAGGILCKILRSIVLTHQTYFSCGVELIDKLEAAAAASEELKPNAGAVKWVNDMISTYRAWFATMRRLGAQ